MTLILFPLPNTIESLCCKAMEGKPLPFEKSPSWINLDPDLEGEREAQTNTLGNR